jgi:hypothetical protein
LFRKQQQLPPPEDYDENDIIMDEIEDGDEGS